MHKTLRILGKTGAGASKFSVLAHIVGPDGEITLRIRLKNRSNAAINAATVEPAY